MRKRRPSGYLSLLSLCRCSRAVGRWRAPTRRFQTVQINALVNCCHSCSFWAVIVTAVWGSVSRRNNDSLPRDHVQKLIVRRGSLDSALEANLHYFLLQLPRKRPAWWSLFVSRMAEVLLHVYDVTNSLNVKANTAIVQLNKLMRDGMGVGGIFHGAIQVYEEEWSFGYCEHGSGVFSCAPKENPMYTYRETVPLGHTTLSPLVVNQILTEMSREWQGCTYDLLARNCNHFCEVFCARLGVQKLPLWVNRFAKTGDAAVEVAGNTMERLKQAREEVVSAGRVAYRYLFGDRPTSSAVSPDPGLSDSRLGGSNSSGRLTFSRTPSRILARTSVYCPVEESLQKENSSKVENERNTTSFFLWNEPSLRGVLGVEESKN